MSIQSIVDDAAALNINSRLVESQNNIKSNKNKNHDNGTRKEYDHLTKLIQSTMDDENTAGTENYNNNNNNNNNKIITKDGQLNGIGGGDYNVYAQMDAEYGNSKCVLFYQCDISCESYTM